MPLSKSSRIAFFRGFTEHSGHGYQQYSDTSLPVCWLEQLVALHYDEIERSVQDPDFARDVFEHRRAPAAYPRFALNKSNPTYTTDGNTLPLVAGKYVQEYARDQARTLEELIIETAPLPEITYLSVNGGHNHSGMRFSVSNDDDDDSSKVVRFFVKGIMLEPGVFEMHPELEVLVLAKLEDIANSYTDAMLQGFRDDCANPYSWKSDVREELYLLPEAAFDAGGLTKEDAIATAEDELARSSQIPL